MSLLAFFAFGVFARGAIAGALEMNVSFSAGAAFTQEKLFSVARKIDNRFARGHFFSITGWPNNGADGDFHDLVRRGAPVHFFPHPVSAAFCFDDRLVEKIGEIVGVSIRVKNHVTAASAVSAVRPAFRYELLPPETHGTASAASGLNINFDPIDKHFLKQLMGSVRRTSMLKGFSLIVFFALAGFCFAQSSPAPTPTPPFAEKTGVDGRITMSPSHPGPARPGIENSKPMANVAFVMKGPNGATEEFTTDEQGHFKVSVPPGHYIVTKQGAETKIGRCGPFDVLVAAGQLTHVEWNCDTGMR